MRVMSVPWGYLESWASSIYDSTILNPLTKLVQGTRVSLIQICTRKHPLPHHNVLSEKCRARTQKENSSRDLRGYGNIRKEKYRARVLFVFKRILSKNNNRSKLLVKKSNNWNSVDHLTSLVVQVVVMAPSDHLWLPSSVLTEKSKRR